MAKQPYIPFYCGDYIKDTRKLPLAVRGAWMDLLLFMWDEEVKGEITDTIEGFAGMLGCTKEEANFAISLLIEKKVCSHKKLPGDKLTIINRRMKKEASISAKRSESGKKGFEEKAKNKQKKEFAGNLPIAKDKQIPDIDYDNEIDNEIKGKGYGERIGSTITLSSDIPLPPNALEAAERSQYTLTKNKNTVFVKEQWVVFLHERMNDPPEKKSQYRQMPDLTGYFLNWVRNKHPKNGNQHTGNSKQKPIPTGDVSKGGFGNF